MDEAEGLQLVFVPGGAPAVAALQRLAVPVLRQHGCDDVLPELFPEQAQQLPRFTLLRAPASTTWQGDASTAFHASSSGAAGLHSGLVIIRAAGGLLPEQVEQQATECLLLPASSSINGTARPPPQSCCTAFAWRDPRCQRIRARGCSVSASELREASTRGRRLRPHQPTPELVPVLLPAAQAFLQDLAAAIAQHNSQAGGVLVAPLTLSTVQQTAAAVGIQAAWRSRAVRARHRAGEPPLVLRAVRCIQAAWRAFVLRRRLAMLSGRPPAASPPSSGEAAAAASSRRHPLRPLTASYAPPPPLLQRIQPTPTLLVAAAAAAAAPCGTAWLPEEPGAGMAAAAAPGRGLQFRVSLTSRLPHLIRAQQGCAGRGGAASFQQHTQRADQPLQRTPPPGAMPAEPPLTMPPACAVTAGGIVSQAASAASNDQQQQQRRRDKGGHSSVEAGDDGDAGGASGHCLTRSAGPTQQQQPVSMAEAASAAQAMQRAAALDASARAGQLREQRRAARSQASGARHAHHTAASQACQQAAAARRSVLWQWHEEHQAAAASAVSALKAVRRAGPAVRLAQQQAATALAAACNRLGRKHYCVSECAAVVAAAGQGSM